MTRLHLLFVLVISLSLASIARAQQTSIQNSPHNLSASGPGQIRAATEQEICIFCHTPHNAAPITPLWNRTMPVQAYTVYSSNSLVAQPGQPTGSSKLCLSCHDGTIALGSVLSRSQGIQMVGGMTTLPPGHKTNLGTDLSDDHPISFRYDSFLATRNPKLRPPQQLPQQVHLDRNAELQCTSCHDAHNDQWGKFLVMDNSHSQLCSSCHNQGTTTIVGHAECASCHQQHTAPSGPYLLTGKTVTETCLPCHNGGNPPQGKNVQLAMRSISMHNTNPPVNLKSNAPNNIACNDCHEPHTMENQTAVAPTISPKLGAVAGVNAAGATITKAQYEYEVCFKCHSTQNASQPTITRQIVQNDVRLQVAAAAVSFHPIEVAGKNANVPSLRPGLTTGSMIYCTDCHSSDTGTVAGGGGANGPHGSNNTPLLVAPYSTLDNSAESSVAYALCYRCHERSSIIGNQSFPAHSLHVVDRQTPCSVCHDSHGISSAQGTSTNHAHLINFDINIVQRDPVSGLLEYRMTGSGSGQCYLTCHGVPHSPKSYAVGTPVTGSTSGGALTPLGAPKMAAPKTSVRH